MIPGISKQKHLQHMQLQDLAKYQPASPGTTILGRMQRWKVEGLISNPQNDTKTMSLVPRLSLSGFDGVRSSSIISMSVFACLTTQGQERPKLPKSPRQRQPRARKQAPKRASMRSGTSRAMSLRRDHKLQNQEETHGKSLACFEFVKVN